MARKHPSSEHIQSMLREGHFGESRELPAADPLTETQLLLEIDSIETYEHNPRKERNPRYDEIKESIRAQGGLNNPLTVTRRPGDNNYIVESGGNTRLHILKALWQETGDGRFRRIHCLFRPWVSESHVLTAHLIENDKRGELTFIDKALGVRELRRVLETEKNETFSQRQLVEALRERGYALDQSTISRMDYAVDVLLPLIPEALRSGMGLPQIRRIRRLETACLSFWSDRQEAMELFEVLFSEAMAGNDGSHWDIDIVQRELETRMAERCGQSLKHIRLEVDARLASGTGEPPPSKPALTEVSTAPDMTTPVTDTQSSSKQSENPASVLATNPPNSEAEEKTTGLLAGNTNTGERKTNLPESSGETPTTTTPQSKYDGPADLKSLRSRCYVLALKLAKRHGLEECITTAGKLGMGYLVDIPPEPIIPVAGRQDALDQLYRQWVWWLLLSLSEESVQPERMERLPDELLLRNLVLEKNDAQALALVGEPDWKALGYELLCNPSVPQSTIDDLLALAQSCRHIRQLTDDDGGLALWRSGG